jgi:hypothetical protein
MKPKPKPDTKKKPGPKAIEIDADAVAFHSRPQARHLQTGAGGTPEERP